MSTFDRPGWDEYYLLQVQTISLRADCRRRKVGAILVADDNRPLGQGYNGTDPGKPGCLSGACPRGLLSYAEQPAMGDYSNCISRHAEHNALLNIPSLVGIEPGTAYFAEQLRWQNPRMYVTDEPCDNCKELMLCSGVMKAIWPEGEIAL